jgi:hypothetical protein
MPAPDELDIPDDCWRFPSGPIAMGDVCQAVPMGALVDGRLRECLVGAGDPAAAFVPARFSFGLVIGVLNGYAVVAAVGTAATVPDHEEFARLLGRGRTARSYARLPLIPEDDFDVWEAQDGVVLFSHVESFRADEALEELRVASMTSHARGVLRARIARLLDDG